MILLVQLDCDFESFKSKRSEQFFLRLLNGVDNFGESILETISKLLSGIGSIST